MNPSDLKSLAEAWVAFWLAEAGSAEREALFWVCDHEWDLVRSEPLVAWAMILEIFKINSSNKIQEVLAAGPLEDLLAEHGTRVIDLVEFEAKKSRAFAKLLGGVWQNSMNDEIWKRIQAVWDLRGWDGVPTA